MDRYGHPILLTFEGNPEYRSSIGGIVSILTRLLVASYFIYLVGEFLRREKYTVSSSVMKNSPLNIGPTTDIQLTKNNFDFIILLECFDCEFLGVNK